MSKRSSALSSLGLARDADEATIKKAFKKLALKHHPDRNPNNVVDATERFKVVNEAYTWGLPAWRVSLPAVEGVFLCAPRKDAS